MNKKYNIITYFIACMIVLTLVFQAEQQGLINRSESKNPTKNPILRPIHYEQRGVKISRIDTNPEIQLNPIENFSGKTKDEILEKRKRIVNESIVFESLKNYTPSDNVFRIQDGLKWIGAHQVSCYGAPNNPLIGEGASRESVGILNPELLYYITIGIIQRNQTEHYCSEIDYMIPHKVTYDKSAKTIRAYFNYREYVKKNGRQTFILCDSNAHDLGYKYTIVDMYKNIAFIDNGFTKNYLSPNGFYHKGFACGLPEGCNNYSPSRPEYQIYIPRTPAMINISLWKKSPKLWGQKEDINYQMIFE